MTDPEVVLITGARKGIGRYLAERYAARGRSSRGAVAKHLIGRSTDISTT